MKLLQMIREEFETHSISLTKLATLYAGYAKVGDTRLFISRSQACFPNLNCGIATLYLQDKLGFGKIIQGSYKGIAHTFLKLPDATIMDITADQFGGPKMYHGPLTFPWSTFRPSSLEP